MTNGTPWDGTEANTCPPGEGWHQRGDIGPSVCDTVSATSAGQMRQEQSWSHPQGAGMKLRRRRRRRRKRRRRQRFPAKERFGIPFLLGGMSSAPGTATLGVLRAWLLTAVPSQSCCPLPKLLSPSRAAVRSQNYCPFQNCRPLQNCCPSQSYCPPPELLSLPGLLSPPKSATSSHPFPRNTPCG